MSLTHCLDCRRLCFVNSTSCPSCAVLFRPGALRAAAAEEKSFRRRSNIMFLIPFAGALAAMAVVLMRN